MCLVKKGAQRVRNRMDQKGMTRQQAEKRERGRQIAGAILKPLAVAGATIAILNADKIAKGAKHVKNKALDKMFDTTLYDANGKVLKRWNSGKAVSKTLGLITRK